MQIFSWVYEEHVGRSIGAPLSTGDDTIFMLRRTLLVQSPAQASSFLISRPSNAGQSTISICFKARSNVVHPADRNGTNVRCNLRH